MALTPAAYKVFKRLLMGLPSWSDEDKRESFIKDALWGHALLNSIPWKLDGDTTATRLLELCDRSEVSTGEGKSPLCALLAAIREKGWADADRLEALARDLGCTARRPAWHHDPYPGLLALDWWQAPIFFGRRTETDDLLRRLATGQGGRFLLVTGASGSGKSSLVRAGVWAALAAGTAPGLPNARDWLITAMCPDDQRGADRRSDPFCALTNSLKQHLRLGWLTPGSEAETLKAEPGAFASLLGRALKDQSASAEWLLILDQMEELFTPACADLREPFLDLLLRAVAGPRFRVIATVRSDFIPKCLEHPGLLAVQNRGGCYGVRTPGREAMIQMVKGPVADLNPPLTLDPDLVRHLVDDADALAGSGGLALLAFALADLYGQCRATGRMDLAAYQHADFGELKGVIRSRADQALGRAGEAGRAALPQVFSRLLTVQPDGTATRRREDLSHWAADPGAQRLIAEFTGKDTRLLVLGSDDRPTLEVAHEALLREWPTLAAWVRDYGPALRLRDKVEEEASAWAAAGRPRHRLWRHEVLEPARALLAEADLLERLEADPDAAGFLIPEGEWLLAELLCGETDHARREAIGMRLCEIGDPRPGVGVIDGVPDILWCEVPGGEVFIEDAGSFAVAPFRIAAYPVTYAQYRAFLDAADGYRDVCWWVGLTQESGPGRQQRP